MKYPAEVAPIDLRSAWEAEPSPLAFALPGLALGTVGNLVGSGGTGKSFVALSTALGVAVGSDVCDLWGVDPVRGLAVYVSLEDPAPVLRRRLWAMRDFVEPGRREQAIEGLAVLPCAGTGASVASGDGQSLQPSEWFRVLSDQIKRIRPRVVFFDTLNRLLGGVSENDAGPIGWTMSQLEKLALEADCAVVLCHHVTKGSLSSSADEAHAARGSSALTDNARWQANLSRPLLRDRRYDGWSDEDRRERVRLSVTKSSYGPAIAERWLRRGPGGVLTYCPLPSPLDESLSVKQAPGPSARTLARTPAKRRPKKAGT